MLHEALEGVPENTRFLAETLLSKGQIAAVLRAAEQVDCRYIFDEIVPPFVRLDECFNPHDASIEDDFGRGKFLLKLWAQCRRCEAWWRGDAPEKQIRVALYKNLKERCIPKAIELCKVVGDPATLDAFLSAPENFEKIKLFSTWFLDPECRKVKKTESTQALLQAAIDSELQRVYAVEFDAVSKN